ncbi:MAG: glutamate synthase-related protein, partial [Burkholderiaceae bacterium]
MAYNPLEKSRFDPYWRYSTLALVALVTAALAVGWTAGWWRSAWSAWWLLVGALLIALGLFDVAQPRHTILRNYPLLGHFRFLFEYVRPELRQYLFESDVDSTPFSRLQRAMVYQRAKQQLDTRPFGTQHDVYATGYEWINHSITPASVADADFRVTIGSPDCALPYSASIFNISAMSFGALSGNAILALNKGAKLGGFAHDTGEGSISRYHREHGGDLIWEIGSG